MLPEAISPGVLFCESGWTVQAAPLLQLGWLRHASTTRSFSDREESRVEEIRRLQEHMDVAGFPLFHADQRHTANVGVVTHELIDNLSEERRYVFPQTDAIVCPVPNVTLAILTADCAPIFLADQKTRSIALAHAGWKGTLHRVAEAVVAALIQTGSNPSDLIAWVGPMAGGCCYEVSPEMVDLFTDGFTDAAARGVEFSQGRNLDLVALNAFQLRNAGVTQENIFYSNLCTIHHRDHFHSYRADQGSNGRIVSIMTALA